MNEGKKFENAFQKSVPDHIFYHRLPDPATSFSGASNLRFSQNNPCDVFLYDPTSGSLYALELKSTKGTSFSYWREDFDDPKKKKTFMIHKHQIIGLQRISKYKIKSGFVLNFRAVAHTYFLSIDDFLLMTEGSDKKSFNETDVINNNGIIIEQKLMRTNYKYDIENFIKKVQI